MKTQIHNLIFKNLIDLNYLRFQDDWQMSYKDIFTSLNQPIYLVFTILRSLFILVLYYLHPFVLKKEDFE